nr:putative ribonuclease H-like domain-containing protein [Tanacetum cinerariifolium]
MSSKERGIKYGRKTVLVENPTEDALIAQDRIGGYDWSYQAVEEHPTNYALMALTSSGSSSSSDFEENVKSRLDKGYHAVPPPYTWNYIPPKPNLMFINEHVKSRYVDVVSNVSSSAVKTVELKVESVDVKNKDKLKTAGTPVNIADSKQIVNYSRPISNDFKRGYSQAIRPFNKYSTYNKTIFNKEVNDVKASACKGNPQQLEYKEKGVIDSGCFRHMTKTNAILLIMKIMMVDLFPLEMVNIEYLEKKGKQHKASYKEKLVNSISKPLHMLHMDLFGPTNVKSLMKKSYFLVITDDFSSVSMMAQEHAHSSAVEILLNCEVKEKQEKDKIGSKPDKNGKRVEARKSLKQLHWVEEEKLNKTQKEWPETQTQSKAISVLKERRKERG